MTTEHNERGALDDLRVVDFTHRVSGPYCTKLLAGFGADVIKIEPPGSGDPERSIPPFAKNTGQSADSLSFLWLNTGKKSVALDLKTPAGLESALSLIAGADVVVENFSPGVMTRLGLDYDALKQINPHIIMLSISNFGQTGPYRDFKAQEIQLSALSGIMDSTGSPQREPLSAGPKLNQYIAGLHGYLAILFALEQRQSSHTGQYIDLSIMESSIEQIENRVHGYLAKGTVATRGPHPFVPWGNFACKDGYVTVIGAPFRRWPQGSKLFGDSVLASEEFYHLRDRIENRALINQHVKDWAEKMSRDDIFEIGQHNGMSFGHVASLGEAFDSSQHQARHFFQTVEHPELGAVRYCDAPFKMHATPWITRPAPALGEHDTLLRGLGEPDRKTKRSGAVGGGTAVAASTRQPLEGLRVIDFTHSWAGPHCTRLLADYGAEVIKIEYPGRLCFFRGGRTQDQAYNKQAPWDQINRNKQSVALDLNRPSDRDMLHKLIETADVCVSNSRPGVMTRLGCDYATLAALKPDIIMLSMSAFGETGPYADYCAYGAVMEGLGGIQSLTRYKNDATPQRIREMDVINGIGGAAAIATALHYRRLTGQGQFIDLSQMELASHALIGEQLLQWGIDGETSTPVGNASKYFAPQGCYPCVGENRWITLSITTEQQWSAFCQLVQAQQSPTDADSSVAATLQNDSRFTSNESRLENQDALDDVIMQWTTTREHTALMAELQRAGVAAAAVVNVAELADDPHLKSRDYFHSAASGSEDARASQAHFVGVPFKLDGMKRIVQPGPQLGEHNLKVGRSLPELNSDSIPVLDDAAIRTAYDY
ncbi:putative CoA-transferase [Halioglobus japonicus]|nr:putative CoA-transferase [Halioglobus japonicus]